jgi:hypothetical protein
LGDIGSAIGGMFGGGGAAASAGAGLTDADFAGLTDADIMGSGASAAGGLFGGASGGLSQFAQAMSALGGGGSSGGGGAAGGTAAGGGGSSDGGLTPTAQQAVSTAPSAGGVGASGGTQSGSAAAPGQPSGSAQDGQPPKSALDELRKLLQGGQKPAGAAANPYVTGGGASNQQPPWVKPMATPPFRPTEGGAIPGWTDPTAGDAETDLPALPGRGTPPPAQPAAPGGDAAPEIGPGSAAASAGVPAIVSAIARGSPLGAAGAVMSPTSTAAATQDEAPASSIPPDQRNMPYPGQRYAPDPSVAAQPQITPPGTTQGGAGKTTPIGGGAGNVQQAPTGTPATPAPALGGGPGNEEQAPTGTPKPDPKTGLPSDPASGKPMTPERYKKWFDQQTKGDKPSKDATPASGNLPTKKGGPAAATPTTPAVAAGGGQPRPGSLLSDILGGTGSNPMALVQLAAAVLPMLMGGMGGGGRRGRFRGGGGFGRFGGFRGGMNAMRGGGHGPLPAFRGGNLPAGHYPNMQGGFHYHPGGFHEGWPAHPNWGGQQGGGGDTSGLAGLLGGGGSGGGGGASGNYTGPGSGSVNAGATVTAANGPWSDNSFLSTLVGAESGGRQGPNVRGDGGQAKGFFQFHDGTWQKYAQNVPGASQYASAEDAPAEVQQQVAMSAPIREWGPRTKQILHAKFGAFDEHQTIGQLSGQFGGGGGGTRPATAPAPAANANPLATASPANIKPVADWQPVT